MTAAEGTAPIRLLAGDGDGAAPTFDRVEELLAEAERSVEIFMFVWRNDEIGNRLGRAVLAAARRGVRIRIKKDVAAVMYERIEMNRKSFFHLPLSTLRRWKFRVFGLTFPDTYVEDDFDDEVGAAVMSHPNVEIDWVHHTHTKYYIFDERVMLTGSINVEDRHRGYQDYMFEIAGEEHVRRFRERDAGLVGLDSEREIDFLLNRITPAGHELEIKPRMIAALDEAVESVYIEMAYIGDPDLSQAIVNAAGRGVEITMLFSREANIGDDLNWRALHRICRRAPVQVVITDKMIHSKLMLIDNRQVIAGSANLSVFSMRKAVELDVVVRGLPRFLESVQDASRRRIAEGHPVESPDGLKPYSRVLAGLQQLHQWLT